MAELNEEEMGKSTDHWRAVGYVDWTSPMQPRSWQQHGVTYNFEQATVKLVGYLNTVSWNCMLLGMGVQQEPQRAGYFTPAALHIINNAVVYANSRKELKRALA